MNNLQIFKNEKFGEMRTTEINNIPYICLVDICKMLEIKNVSDCKTRLNQDGVVTTEVGVQTGYKKDGTPAMQMINMTFINESNLYKVIFQSRKPEAEKFTEWVTSEVLPSIRKNGMYATNELLDNPDLAIKVFKQLKQEREQKKQLQLENAQQKQLIGELKPKVDYLDKILKSKSVVPISYIAKDYGMTAQALNKRLHDLGIQYKIGNTWLLYREHQSFGYTHSKITEFERKDGTLDTSTTMEWTQKGRLFLYELLKKDGLVPVIER